MTTRVVISNPSGPWDVMVHGGSIGLGIGGRLLKPGECCDLHFWKDAPITLTEMDPKDRPVET
jgi:hypothetical protein